MSNSSTHILEVSGLAIGYQDKYKTNRVLQDIQFTVQAGELVAIVGSNGVGKSTLLRTLSKVQPFLDGKINVSGQSITSYSPNELAQQISLVLTENPASKMLTVEEIIALGRLPYTSWNGTLQEHDILSIQKAITNAQVNTLQKKHSYQLSDGQLQRVLIARALAQDTPLIILDEPTTHLDIYHKAYIGKLLQSLAKTENKAIVFATHEIDLAIQLCHKILILTPTTCYYDTPKKLIEEKRFDSLFPKEYVFFDSKTGRFTINN